MILFKHLLLLKVYNFIFSTHDGTAIANAVLNYIVQNIGCRMIFSTHYHTICKKVTENKELTNKIRLAHMVFFIF